MKSEKIIRALELIDQSGLGRPYLNDKYAVSDEQVHQAEDILGWRFPDSYHYFLTNLGSGDFEGAEFYGLIPGEQNCEEIPNGLWFTLEERKNMNLPNGLFAFENHDGDAVSCLALSLMQNGECPVILWEYSESYERQLQRPHILAETFGDYFLQKVRELIEDAAL